MHSAWVKSNLWHCGYCEPERLGPKKTIYSVNWRGPLVSLLLDSLDRDPPWRLELNSSYTDSFFNALEPLVQRHGATWLYIVDPADSFSEVVGEVAAGSNRFESHRLMKFESEQLYRTVIKRLCLLFNDRMGMVVIERSRRFEIAYYGAVERWHEVANSLGIPPEPAP